jgi:hypothetical protein
MRLPCAALLLALALPAADLDFNGAWNITVPNARNRVWWLEVKGAGTPSPSGSFVGAPGGQVDRIEDLRIQDGELRFTFQRTREDRPLLLTYRARLSGPGLTGSVEESVPGATPSLVQWTAVRAPKLADTDGPRWKPGTPVDLINGKDLSSWRQLIPSRPGWYIEDGHLRNRAGASDLVSLPRFWNFELRAEYRYSKGSNSGIALRGRYEVQIFDDFGQPASFHGNGALYCRETPRVNASRPPGEWQTLVVRLVGRDLTVTLNGEKTLDRVQAWPTAMAMDAAEDQPGPIVLQGDHGPVEFRLLRVTPLQ